MGKQIAIERVLFPQDIQYLDQKINELGLLICRDKIFRDTTAYSSIEAITDGSMGLVRLLLPGYQTERGELRKPSYNQITGQIVWPGRIYVPTIELSTGNPVHPELIAKMTQLMAYWKKISKKTPAQTA